MANSGKNRLWPTVTAIIVLLIVVLGGYWIWKVVREKASPERPPAETALPRMANLPPKKETIPLPPPPSYGPDAPILEEARKALKDGIDPSGAVALAQSLPEGPERADAVFLLLEYAADSGNAEAALAVARFYDPTDTAPSGTIRKNPTIAYEWYQEALAGGQQEAKNHLSKLQAWVETQATQGSREAQALLKNWQ
ncbi:MAG: hypothetical protein JSW39_15520 [Desulfobacterales bacterium]|nr:MAG: hypothetical protein JSW39_15520 [Desulfobacterales bacterium]